MDVMCEWLMGLSLKPLIHAKHGALKRPPSLRVGAAS